MACRLGNKGEEQLLRVDGARMALTPNLRYVESGQPVCGEPGLSELGRRGGIALVGTQRSALGSNTRGEAPTQPGLTEKMSQGVLLESVRCR